MTLQMSVQQEPLALVFEYPDTGAKSTALLDAESGLFLVINLLFSSTVFERIKMPRFLKRLIIWALTQSCPKIPEIRI